MSEPFFGNGPVFDVPASLTVNGWELFACVLLGVVGGVIAALFLQVLRASSELFSWSRLPRPIAMAVVGLALGLVTLGFPEVVGNGRDAIQDLFQHQWGAGFVLTLLGLRLLLTPAAVGSGTVGGVFTPTLFLGAVLRAAFGLGVHGALPSAMAGSTAVGQTLKDSRFRERYGVSILMINRRASGKEVALLPEASTRLQAGDKLVVFGAGDKLQQLAREI